MGLLVVLRRAKDRELGLWFRLSTAAARWRPAGQFWKRRGAWLGREGSSARLEGGGGGRPRRVGASARRSNGRENREGVGGGAVGGVGGEKQSREGEIEIRVDLQLPKVPGTSL